MTLAFRPWEEGDRRFVEQTFLDNYRTANAAGLIAMDDWTAVMGPQIRKLLARPGVTVLVAHNPREADSRADLYGWVAVERGHQYPLVLFVYVKEPYRRLGVARGLMKAIGIEAGAPFHYAARTAVLAKMAHVMPRSVWTPLAVRFPPP